MRRLIPSVEDEAIEEVYSELVLPAIPDRAWIALGMVASLDGAATRAGVTEGLGGPADHHSFRALRGACDAVMVGAGTVRAEGYGPAAGTPARQKARVARGLAPAPRLVIVSGTLDLDPAARVFGDPAHPPLVYTHEQVHPERVTALQDVAELVRIGQGGLDLEGVLVDLNARGLRRVLCEGGPTLNGALLELDAVDEVFLTIDPVLLGGPAPRIVQAGIEVAPRPMSLVELREHDGELLVRYRRDRNRGSVAVAGG